MRMFSHPDRGEHPQHDCVRGLGHQHHCDCGWNKPFLKQSRTSDRPTNIKCFPALVILVSIDTDMFISAGYCQWTPGSACASRTTARERCSLSRCLRRAIADWRTIPGRYLLLLTVQHQVVDLMLMPGVDGQKISTMSSTGVKQFTTAQSYQGLVTTFFAPNNPTS